MSAHECETNTKFVSESVTLVTVYLDNLIPEKASNTQKAKNGKVTIEFFKRSFNLKAEVWENKDKPKKYKLIVHRLPSEIENKECSWKLEKGVAKITLIKKKERDADGVESYVDWKPIVHSRGLDQYDSSEDEDGNVTDPVPFRSQSDKLEQCGFNVVRGKTNEFEVDAEEFENVKSYFK